MEKSDLLAKWALRLGVTWVCLVLICLIAALSGYCVSLSPRDGFRFTVCAQ